MPLIRSARRAKSALSAGGLKLESQRDLTYIWSMLGISRFLGIVIPRVIEAKYEHDYTVYVRFDDGMEGDLDLRDELYGAVFEPLKDPQVFTQVSIHPDFHTLCWPNGADFAPEFLYDRIRIPA